MRHLLLFVFLAYICCAGCKNSRSTSETTTSPEVVESNVSKKTIAQPAIEAPEATNKAVPNFPFDIELKDADGQIHKSDKVFKNNGKPTVLFFWLTTCGPCHMKLNAIKPLYPQWKEEADFNAFAISGDFPRNYEKFCTQTKSKNWEWETYNDVNRSFREILPGGLNGYPQTFIYDKDGKLVYQDKKYRPGDETRLFAKIKEICAG